MIKAILFDIDGVLLETGFFSERLSEKYGIPLDKILPFFKGPYRDCQLGKADLYTELDKAKTDWGFPGETSDIIELWFSDIIPNLNKPLLTKIQNIREEGKACYIATNQEANRADFLWEDASLSDNFDGIFASYELGIKKPANEYFKAILNNLSLQPYEIAFFDSDQEVVDAANDYGLKSFLYTTQEDFEKTLLSI